MKIKYKINKQNKVITVCKHYQNILVGSIKCSECNYFERAKTFKKMTKYIICHKGEEVKDEN